MELPYRAAVGQVSTMSQSLSAQGTWNVMQGDWVIAVENDENLILQAIALLAGKSPKKILWRLICLHQILIIFGIK